MSAHILLAVSVGGALGSLLRYLLTLASRSAWPDWPLGTLAVNVLGSLVMGLLFALFLQRPSPEWLRLGLMTGVLGGFTTFSAFSLDTLQLWQSAGLLSTALYVSMNVTLSLLACATGVGLFRLAFS
ncbi:MAG: fluoride efflux transporter CrcB [Panacagrimonas sp.]